MNNYIVGDGPVGISLATMIKGSYLVVPTKRLSAHHLTPPKFKRKESVAIHKDLIISFDELCKIKTTPKTIWLAITAGALKETAQSLLPTLTDEDRIIVTSNGLDLLSEIPPTAASLQRMTVSYPVQFRSVLQNFAKKEPEDSVVEMSGTEILRVGLTDNIATDIKDTLADFEVTYYPDTKALEWHKALINCSLNPITVILHRRNNAVLTNPNTARLVLHLMSEIISVGTKEGVSFRTTAAKMLESSIAFSGDNINGSLAARLAGKNADFDFNIAKVLKHAAEHKISVPYLDSVYALLMAVL